MPRLIIVNREGEERSVEGGIGVSVMEVLRANGYDEVQALCGGACSCATCHVRVDPAFADKVSPQRAEETDMLEACGYGDATSRLSCQIYLTTALEGLKICIVAED